MGEVDEIGPQAFDHIARRLREDPPAPPVTRTHEPGIDQQRRTAVLQQHTGMAEDRELHRNPPRSNSASAAVPRFRGPRPVSLRSTRRPTWLKIVNVMGVAPARVFPRPSN